MKNILVTCFFTFGFAIVLNAQTPSIASRISEISVAEEKLPLEKPVIAGDNAVKVKDNLNFNEGTIPTPEEQGFIKQTINGKDTYFKEDGQILIQYTPKNN